MCELLDLNNSAIIVSRIRKKLLKCFESFQREKIFDSDPSKNMITLKTDFCFLSGRKIIGINQAPGDCFDGYFYVISFDGEAREVRLSYEENWKDDSWAKTHGKVFLELLNKNMQWDYFKSGRTLDDIKIFYDEMKINEK